MRGRSSTLVSPVQGASLDATAPARGVSLEIGTDIRTVTLLSGSAVSRSRATANWVATLDAAGASVSRSRAVASLSAALNATGAAVSRSRAVATGGTTYVASTIASILGSRLHWWFEVGVSAETLVADGGNNNFSQLNDIGPGGYHAVQATVGDQPRKGVGTGPNGKNCVTFQGTNRLLLNNSIALSAGRALTIFQVQQAAAAGLSGQFSVRGADGALGANAPFQVGTASAGNVFRVAYTVQGSATTAFNLTSPAAQDANWRLWVMRFATGVVPVLQAGTAATSPAFVNSGKSEAVEALVIGGSGSGAGSSYLFIGVEDCTNDEETLIRAYITQQTGLS